MLTRLLSVSALLLLSASTLANELSPAGYRVLESFGKYGDTTQFAVTWDVDAPSILRANRIELAAGTFTSGGLNHGFVSAGPVWRLPLNRPDTLLEFGLSPTLLSSSDFENRDLGGKFHFTSSVELAKRFGRSRQFSLSLRVQHTSNGGLHASNPGLDMVGVVFRAYGRN